ncbi:hypothetical protein SAMN02745165_01749 [Malonomonas rubra DSM 5091]|uniref:DUF6915 domain-containing protein n=1 Tax=Malonomonas rubra DSM 5091 TaxID=1122189 RepID=A0A1M6H9R3_MALRU|nr:hypothetical protein [Malonomonas rubra]SHJ18972.1 hypothetical protein SAMN02745165_01749 [Malonomonas rubra DSM 5091]
MNQEQHEKACQEKFGQPWPEVHAFLDQYFDLARSMTHRVILHHRKGIELVVEKFGEAARGPAEQHVELDFGFIPDGPADMDKYFCPTSWEEERLVKEQIKALFGLPDDWRSEPEEFFNKMVLVRSTDNAVIETLLKHANYTGEIIQCGDNWGFAAYFDIPRPTKENCREANEFITQAIKHGADYYQCSVLATWTNLELFVFEGRKEPL